MKLFIYGTLKRQQSRAGALDGQRFIGEAKTLARYRLFDTGSYPVLVGCHEVEDGGLEIEGELWHVDADCLARLDEIECVPELFRRQPVMLSLPAGYDDVETYIYQRSVMGLRDCGARWPAS